MRTFSTRGTYRGSVGVRCNVRRVLAAGFGKCKVVLWVFREHEKGVMAQEADVRLPDLNRIVKR